MLFFGYVHVYVYEHVHVQDAYLNEFGDVAERRRNVSARHQLRVSRERARARARKRTR